MSHEGVRFSYDIQKKKIQFGILGAAISMEKNHESFSMLFFCNYVIFLMNISMVVKIS